MKLAAFSIGMLLGFPGMGVAQLLNGDFSQGSVGWTLESLRSVQRFPAPGVDGTFYIWDSVAGDAANISQAFDCGDAPCEVSVDYLESGQSEMANHTGSLSILVDGLFVLTKPAAFTPIRQWTTYSVTATPGPHSLKLSLGSVDNVRVEIDNVRMTALVPILPATWGSIKARLVD